MRPVEEKTFRTHDGVELFYRHWPAMPGAARGAIVLFHRGHEHSGRMAHLADELDLPDFAVFAWDARGHGRSPGERGFSPSLGTSVRDVQTFVDHIATTYGIAAEDIAVVAQSVGAVLVATWAHDYAPKIRCMVLASPAFRVKLYVPFARTGLKLMHKLRGNFFVNSYVKSRFLTHDPERIKSFDADPLIARADRRQHPAGALRDGGSRGRRRPRHHHPDAAPDLRSGFRRASRPAASLLRASRHGDQGAPCAAGLLSRHVRRKGAAPRRGQGPPLHPGAFRRAAEPAIAARMPTASALLATKRTRWPRRCPLLSPRGLFWALARRNMTIGGLLSEGIRLGHRTGFDSGSTLDYVYRNAPSGLGPLGRLIDKVYLQSIGWRGIRQRKMHLEELLRATMERMAQRGMPVRILDIAAGHGRYVLEALEASTIKPESVLLRDYSDINVEAGRALIRAKGLDGDRAIREGRRVRREQPGRGRAETDARHRLRPLRALPRQRHGVRARSPDSPRPFRPAAI